MNARRHIRIVAGTESGIGPIVLETIKGEQLLERRSDGQFPLHYASIDLVEQLRKRIAEEDRQRLRARVWVAIFASFFILAAVAIHYVVERETTHVGEVVNG